MCPSQRPDLLEKLQCLLQFSSQALGFCPFVWNLGSPSEWWRDDLEPGWFGDLSEEGSPNYSIFLKLECYVFGEGGTCIQKVRRDCSDNEDPRP